TPPPSRRRPPPPAPARRRSTRTAWRGRRAPAAPSRRRRPPPPGRAAGRSPRRPDERRQGARLQLALHPPHVGLLLEDAAERLAHHLGVEVVGVEGGERPRPVERLRDPRHLPQREPPKGVEEG